MVNTKITKKQQRENVATEVIRIYDARIAQELTELNTRRTDALSSADDLLNEISDLLRPLRGQCAYLDSESESDEDLIEYEDQAASTKC